MNKTKYRRPIPNHKLSTEPANGPITSYIMDPTEMIAKYGVPTSPLKKRYVR